MKNWISDAFIYQVNLRSLAAREPRNPIEAASEKANTVSPLAYLARGIPAIRRLGATVLYLMPPYPIGREGRKGIGSPYSIRNFLDVEEEYGTRDELAEVVRRAHRSGMKVIFDITPNHTSRDHVWTREHPEYYVKDAQGGLYYDYDWSDVAKLDYAQPGLREAMIGVYDHWLSFLDPRSDGTPDGVDGFRLDMAHMISDLSFWDEAMPVLRERHAGRQLLFLAESYGTKNNLDLFSRGINAAYDDDFYKICVYFYAVDERGKSVILPAPHAQHHDDFKDKWEAFQKGGIAAAFECAIVGYEEALGNGVQGPWLARYTDNHDEGRGVYRFGDDAVRGVMQLVFLSSRSLPFVLTGQEFGAANRPPIHERIGTCDKGRRCHGETESGTPPVHECPGIEFEGNSFARGREERMRWYAFYRELAALRKRCTALRRGKFATLDAGERAPAAERTVLAFERKRGKAALRCAVNLGPEPRALERADLFSGELLYGAIRDGILDGFSAVVVKV